MCDLGGTCLSGAVYYVMIKTQKSKSKCKKAIRGFIINYDSITLFLAFCLFISSFLPSAHSIPPPPPLPH